MISKTCLIIIPLLIFQSSGFPWPGSFLKRTVKTALPFDPTIGYAIFKAAPQLAQHLHKMKEVITNKSLSGILSEAHDLMKQTFFRSSIEEDRIVFYQFDRKKEILQQMFFDEMSMEKGKLFLIVPGWLENSMVGDWTTELAKVLVQKYHDCNVILVDWSSSSYKVLYPLAASRTKPVGDILGKTILEIVEKYDYSLQQIVLIGFDLGAHVSGFAGKFIKESSDKSLKQIIALDPSAFLFESKKQCDRLAPSDADVVMVLHTETSFLGMDGKCGTIDFYANGGFEQPGCIGWDLFCSHQRSYKLLTSAISSPSKFPSQRCEDSEEFKLNKCLQTDVYFGDISEKREGSYYFETTNKVPFYKQKAIGTKTPWKWWG